jgi:hypothetical protein
MTVTMVQLPNAGTSYKLDWLSDSRFGKTHNLPLGMTVMSKEGERFPPGSMAAMFGLTVFVDPPVENDLAINISAGCENGPPTSFFLQQQRGTIEHCRQLSTGSNASVACIAGRALGVADDAGKPIERRG